MKEIILNVGDKVIRETMFYGETKSLKLITVEKVNKATYKMNNGELLYKKGYFENELRCRGDSTWGSNAYYYVYTEDLWREKYDKFTRYLVNKVKVELKQLLRSCGKDVILLALKELENE